MATKKQICACDMASHVLDSAGIPGVAVITWADGSITEFRFGPVKYEKPTGLLGLFKKKNKSAQLVN